ncbi:hypothetical protein CM19_04690 [Candidatus Acidianus copahuensis]|uniref:6-phospho-N-acetylmuramidase N-terminal domain-containing protein n=1 Tax=Candidatus Acidianus copahuensis TaxID=1160895 RepID=A0A031LQK7_9CREN|nr:MupG family TIM beta-alpha barrel fold protein [Candidatus Acidianus copahuensis]EZQ10035.1 hypothetical protein CM19_04690 [Candidatus Acidianus copahuensis]
MRSVGLGVYFGIKENRPKYRDYISEAKVFGFSEIFMGIGFILKEKNVDKELKEIRDFSIYAENLGYYVFTDINPEFMKFFNASPDNLEPYLKTGVKGIRLDYGFNVEEMAKIIRNARRLNLYVELNASIFSEGDLEKLSKLTDFENVKASHDFYPPLYTGISLEEVIRKSSPFKRFGIPVGIFVGSNREKLRNTVESLRKYSPWQAEEILFATGKIDRVIIGDPLEDSQDLKKEGEVASRDYIKIRVIPYNISDEERKAFNHVLYSRKREFAVSAGDYIENKVTPRCVVRKFKGSVSIMTNRPDYIEVWIWTKDSPADPTFTIIGEVLEEDMQIVDLVEDHDKILLEAIESRFT